MDDPYLNHYADRYVALRLRAHGVTLDQYLAQPAVYEPLALEPEPLLPAQQAVAARLAAHLSAGDEHDALTDHLEAGLSAGTRLADGGLVEPLRHHIRPACHGARRRFYRGVA